VASLRLEGWRRRTMSRHHRDGLESLLLLHSMCQRSSDAFKVREFPDSSFHISSIDLFRIEYIFFKSHAFES
jgi:hypothetical protein